MLRDGVPSSMVCWYEIDFSGCGFVKNRNSPVTKRMKTMVGNCAS